jgi:transcriptional regulator with XRE-family HTH domain
MAGKASRSHPSAGEAIRLLRERAGLSARALSRYARLSPAYVGKVEAGTLDPSLKAFARIAVALNMTQQEIWWLVMAEGTVTPPEYDGEQTFEEGSG